MSKKAVVVCYPDSFRLDEAKGLVASADYEIAQVFTQKYLNHSQYGVGAGKAEEIRDFVQGQQDIEVVVIDEHLTSKQMHNLSKLIGVKAIDRERLILDIFYSRATTTEAKLQIELAEIQYEIPRIRESAKMTSGNERPGKGGMGEYTVDVKFRDLKRRMNFVKEKLADAKKKRELYQRQRARSGMHVVALVGYTSSGKTTLFNLLTKDSRQTSASLFTTLSTTTRALGLDTKKDGFLVVDTVGFISRLPHYMVDAFKSTLEESLAADRILLLVDASEDMDKIATKYASCWEVLEELEVDKSKVVVVLTKHDTMEPKMAQELVARFQLVGHHTVSAKTGYGIHKLRNMLVSSSRIRPVPSQGH